MKAIWISGKQEVGVKDVPVPDRDADEALIAVKACGICGSEMHSYRSGGIGHTGHETVGIVEAPGRSGKLREGDRVVLNVVCGCGECGHCRGGHENYCADLPSKWRSFKPGGHSEKAVYVERNCLPVPDGMSFEAAVAVGGCGVGVAWHGIRRLGIEPGETVPVFGVGPIGLSAAMILRQLKASPLALDVSSYRLDMALRFGAAGAVRSDRREEVEEFCARARKDGVRRSILCTGNHEAATTALKCLAPTGKMLVLGGLSAWPLDSWSAIGIGDKAILGSWHYHRDEWPEILDLAARGLPAKDLVTHVFPFEKAQEAYRAFAAGDTGKVMLTP